MSPVNPGRLLASPFSPPRWRCSFADPVEQPLFAKASAGGAVAQLWCRRRKGLVVPGTIVSLRICRRSARILPRAAGRYGFARSAAVINPRAGHCYQHGLSRPVQRSRSAKPNRSIIRCALCCSAPSRASALPATPGGERFLCDGRYNLACGRRGRARLSVPPSTGGRWRAAATVLAHAGDP